MDFHPNARLVAKTVLQRMINQGRNDLPTGDVLPYGEEVARRAFYKALEWWAARTVEAGDDLESVLRSLQRGEE